MREHVHSASRRRDQRLAHVRKLSLWITGGAAAASLGLGTAFAHAPPGHAASSSSGHAATSGQQAPSGQAPSSGSGNPASSHHAASSAPGSAPRHGRHHRHKLAAPAQQPTQSAAPPVVSSGGS
ncbi:MAG: hypothetical protein WAL16_26990 [Streptosporangiaceae bacterium]